MTSFSTGGGGSRNTVIDRLPIIQQPGQVLQNGHLPLNPTKFSIGTLNGESRSINYLTGMHGSRRISVQSGLELLGSKTTAVLYGRATIMARVGDRVHVLGSGRGGGIPLELGLSGVGE